MPLNSTGDGLQMIRRWSADHRQQIVNQQCETRGWAIPSADVEFVSADKRMGDRDWGLTRICFCGHDDGESSLAIDQNLYLQTRGWVIPTGDLGLQTIICIPGHDDGQSSLVIDQNLYLQTREPSADHLQTIAS
ncbi:hypothetical protein B0H13DRAFT_1876992 [Mycena leptocephala]|nr:hypothetical protein B0H13DRAFT_1876992 [Mycena leptocephala]